MATLGSIRRHHFWMQIENGVKVKASDILKINVTIGARYVHSVHSIETILLKKSLSISYQDFIVNNQDFLRSFMFDPRCSTCFTPSIIDRLSGQIVNMSIDTIKFCRGEKSVDSERQRQELPFNLHIIVEILLPGETTMIPQSEEVIDSLNTFTTSSSLKTKTENCSICMEDLRFTHELSSTPCDHYFHHQCIVKWFKISYTCPICRYPILRS
ncbi:E3 ubiquitin-protein ligase [Vigna unguiculata]|uniref:RING-type E3 ubiquitin transferase n=1 Tax=Vigna unguiculata TaxID=3917 RepID=A0A4D6NET6_VIGUN|nr:E3 ubiquitin-protein ligase [Vigna unguiculata]